VSRKCLDEDDIVCMAAFFNCFPNLERRHNPTRSFSGGIEISFVLLVRTGAPGETRTPDPLVRSRGVGNLNALRGVA
jgi:hypothetical protein